MLWEIFVFTAAIMVVMLAYAGRFEWARVATWVLAALRVPARELRGIPVAVREWRPPEPLIHARAALTVVALCSAATASPCW